MTDKKTISIYDSKSCEYASLTNVNQPSKHLNAFMKEVTFGGTVLDLGCGPGVASAFLKREGFKVVATDASLEMIKIARIENGIDALHQSFDDISWINSFDGIWAHFSLLHASQEMFPIHLDALYKALKPNGVFTIGMKIGKGEKRDDIGRFYAYYSEDQLLKYLKNSGYKIDEINFGEDIGLDGKLASWIIIRSHA